MDQSAFIDKVAPAQMEEPIIRIINVENKLIELKSIATGDDSMEGRSKFKYKMLSTFCFIKLVNIKFSSNHSLKKKLETLQRMQSHFLKSLFNLI